MGEYAKAAVDKISKLTGPKGEYSVGAFNKHCRASPSYTNLKVKENVNKKQSILNMCSGLHKDMVNPLMKDVHAIYADLLADMEAEIKRLNIELSGADETAPVSEAEERYKKDLSMLVTHARKMESLKKQQRKCEKATIKQTEKIFGGDAGNDDSGDEGFSTFNKEELEILKTIKEHAKGIETQRQNSNHELYSQVSSGLHCKDIKTTDRAHFPKTISQLKKKEFVVKIKQYMEHRPEQFSFVLPEARRTMDDVNRRKGTHFSPGTWDEMELPMQEDFRQQNDRLYKAFELNCNPKEFTLSQSQYTYGLSGVAKSFGRCERGDGLRILHFWVSHLCKISSSAIQEVETDLQCLPVSFGTGGIDKIKEAVTAAEELLEKGDEMDCTVQYKTVLQICQVLVRKNPLFVQIHQKYLKPSDVSGRKNSIEDLRALMGDIKEVCDQMCAGFTDDTRTVKVNLGMRVFSISVPEIHGGGGDKKGDKQQEKRKVTWEGKGVGERAIDEKIQKNTKEQHAFSAQTQSECRYEKCTAKAFCHKKERGGHVHESGLCFDHFVEAVRGGKKDKPEGVPLKGGKKMVLKRGEDMRWSFKIMSIMDEVRDNTYIEKADDETIQALLTMVSKSQIDGGGGPDERGVFHAFMKEQEEEHVHKMRVEYEGCFDLRDLEPSMWRGEKKTFDVRHDRAENDSFPVTSNTQ